MVLLLLGSVASVKAEAEAVCASGFEAYTALSVCLSSRSLTYGRCTRSVAGSSSPLATVSGNSTKISSTDRSSEQQTLPLHTLTCPRQPTVPSPCSPSALSLCSLRSGQALLSAPLPRAGGTTPPASSTGPAPSLPPSSSSSRQSTLPALPPLPAHYVWNASKTLYRENIRLYAV